MGLPRLCRRCSKSLTFPQVVSVHGRGFHVYGRRPYDSDLLVAAIETTQHCWDVHPIWWQRTPHSTPPKTRLQRGRRVSNASAIPIVGPKPRTQTRAEKRWFPQRPKVAHRIRGTHQRGQTRQRPVPLRGLRRNEPLGRAQRHRRQYCSRHG